MRMSLSLTKVRQRLSIVLSANHRESNPSPVAPCPLLLRRNRTALNADKRIRTFTTFLLDGLASHCDTITPYLQIPPVTASTPQSNLVEFHIKADNCIAKIRFLFCTWQIGNIDAVWICTTHERILKRHCC